MAVIRSRPTSPGRRFVVAVKSADLHKGKPHAPLLKKKAKTGGRNNLGRITTRHHGGGHRQHYRMVDFKRNKDDILGRVERLEYDPNRSAHLALVLYSDGERRYIIAPKGVKKGSEIMSGVGEVSIKPGNCMPLKNIPVGSVIHCIEIKPGRGAQMVRSAGASAQLVAKEGLYASIRLRSGTVQKIRLNCRAVIGEVSNSEHNLRKLGKAGAKRHRGIRPTVRGVAMNPVDHPHGGGEGKTSGGRHPVSPWGQPTKGYKTRKNKRTTKFIEKAKTKSK